MYILYHFGEHIKQNHSRLQMKLKSLVTLLCTEIVTSLQTKRFHHAICVFHNNRTFIMASQSKPYRRKISFLNKNYHLAKTKQQILGIYFKIIL